MCIRDRQYDVKPEAVQERSAKGMINFSKMLKRKETFSPAKSTGEDISKESIDNYYATARKVKGPLFSKSPESSKELPRHYQVSLKVNIEHEQSHGDYNEGR
eukprot:TRINITY_DN15310_c0_g2_i3.p1 TRINITY_DN15310_c0_g2~~TRINITY_DN15310_c0_g2_i3.p1  ORF type:complete len:117 (-),score=20.53 TRINITY_DN15310_c0_g2_i3:263-568(-)